MEQFTANEVRTESCKQGQLHRQPASDMLNAFADMLEAREKAVPVAQVEDQFGFPIMEWIGDAGEKCLVGTNLYTHPSPADADRLAEALRGILEIGKRNMENQKYDGFFNAAREALAAHSAQAQPPAARVTDAMVERAQDCLHDKGKDIGYYHMRAALEAALAAQENPNG